MIALLKKEMFNDRIREVLSYVPSAIFPAIIFPGIFLETDGGLNLENNPKIIASVIAIIVGVLSKNIIATIFCGLATYWYLIFI
jgi:branched-subunit amino acid transport protein